MLFSLDPDKAIDPIVDRIADHIDHIDRIVDLAVDDFCFVVIVV